MAVKKTHERILLADDSPETLEVLGRNLSRGGYAVTGATSVKQAEKLLREQAFDLVIADLRMPGVSGLELVRLVRETYEDTAVMMITGYATVESAVEAVKSGAEEYLPKPFTDEELMSAVERVLARLRATRLRRTRPFQGRLGLVGRSGGMRQALELLEKARDSGAHVLICGEPGTGRRAAARALCEGEGLWLGLDCSLLAAGTGQGRTSPFCSSELLPAGLLYLWGVESASREAHNRLAELLSRPASVTGCRIVAGGSESAAHPVENGGLPARILRLFEQNVVFLPPLRERGEDVVLLTEHFLEQLSARFRRSTPHLSPAALRAVKSYAWPGNAAELEAVLLSCLLRADDGPIDLAQFPAHIRDAVSTHPALDRPLAEVEEEYILRVLASVEGNKKRAAEILGIDRKTLRERIKSDTE
jgi:DNA-binding NtrC family response regulator